MAVIIFNAYSLMRNLEKGGSSDEANTRNSSVIGIF
jgi:hypothetical protein